MKVKDKNVIANNVVYRKYKTDINVSYKKNFITERGKLIIIEMY